MVSKEEAAKLLENVKKDIQDEVEAARNYQNSAEFLKVKDPFAAGLYQAIAADEQRHRNLLNLIRDGYEANIEDGIVVDAAKAAAGPCECFELPSGKRYCWDQGVIGGLSQGQIGQFCPPGRSTERPGGVPARIEHFIKASQKCEIGKEFNGEPIKDLRDRLRCMSVEARTG